MPAQAQSSKRRQGLFAPIDVLQLHALIDLVETAWIPAAARIST
jgi:hypothetical protein